MKKPDFDKASVIQEALKLLPSPARRLFLKRAVTLGGLSLLSGCSVTDEDSAERMLMKISRLNDDFQAWLFDPNKLAPTYPETHDHEAVPVQCLLRARHDPGDRRRRLSTRSQRPGRGQTQLVAGRTLPAAADRPGHAPYLRRGLERDRQMGRGDILDYS